MAFFYVMMIVILFYTVVTGVISFIKWRRVEKEYGSYIKLIFIYRKEKKKSQMSQIEEDCSYNLEHIPSYDFSAYTTAPKVKFVPFFDTKFSWNKKHF